MRRAAISSAGLESDNQHLYILPLKKRRPLAKVQMTMTYVTPIIDTGRNAKTGQDSRDPVEPFAGLHHVTGCVTAFVSAWGLFQGSSAAQNKG